MSYMHTDTVSIDQFISDHKITMTVEATDHNPFMLESNMDHWKCLLAMGRKRMTMYFSMGFGLGGRQPEVRDVLSCLASDSSWAGMTFEEFCSEFGYEEDSRKAERTHKAVEHQDRRLRNFLGTDLYQVLVHQVEVL